MAVAGRERATEQTGGVAASIWNDRGDLPRLCTGSGGIRRRAVAAGQRGAFRTAKSL